MDIGDVLYVERYYSVAERAIADKTPFKPSVTWKINNYA